MSRVARITRLQGKRQKAAFHRKIRIMLTEGPSKRPRPYRHQPTAEERIENIRVQRIGCGTVIVQIGEVIPRKVIEITEEGYLKLNGYSQSVCPLTVRVQAKP